MTTTIGVYGGGDSNRRNTNALVKDFVAQFDEFSFVLPATVPTFTDAVRHVADLAVEQNYEAAFVADKHDVADLEDYPNIPVSEVESVQETVAGVEHLLVAWSDDLDEEWIENTIRSGVRVYDLTDGLFPITLDDQPEATGDEPEKTTPAPKTQVEEPMDDEPDEAQATIPPQAAQPSQEEVDAAVEKIANRAAEIVLERLRTAL